METPDYCHMNRVIVAIENYIFFGKKEESFIFPIMYNFPWALLALPSGCNQEFPKFPRHISTLFPNTESYVDNKWEVFDSWPI